MSIPSAPTSFPYDSNGKIGNFKRAVAGRSNSKLRKLRSSLGSKSSGFDIKAGEAYNDSEISGEIGVQAHPYR